MRPSSTEPPVAAGSAASAAPAAPAPPRGSSPPSAPLPTGVLARTARVIHHTARLLGDLLAYAVVNRAFGLVALILGLLLLGLVMLAGQAAVPLLYPFF